MNLLHKWSLRIPQNLLISLLYPRFTESYWLQVQTPTKAGNLCFGSKSKNMSVTEMLQQHNFPWYVAWSHLHFSFPEMYCSISGKEMKFKEELQHLEQGRSSTCCYVQLPSASTGTTSENRSGGLSTSGATHAFVTPSLKGSAGV